MKVTWENAENGEIIGREKAKHTRGPWKYDPYWSLIMAGQSEIAAVHAATQAGEKRKRLDEAHANARLIAAAPDLLEACKQAYASLEGLKQSGDNQDWEAYHPLHKAYEMCRTAIQKATGGQ